MDRDDSKKFIEMSDLDLVKMQKELRRFPEDKKMLDEVLKELGIRQKRHNK